MKVVNDFVEFMMTSYVWEVVTSAWAIKFPQGGQAKYMNKN